MRRAGFFALALLVVAGVAVGATLRTSGGGHPADSSAGAAAAASSASSKQTTAAASVSRPKLKFPRAGRLVGHTLLVHKTPSEKAPVIKVLHYFRSDYRPQEILAVSEKRAADHHLWYRINVPERPNGRYGWIRANTVRLRATIGKIVVHIKARTIDVYRHGNHVLHATVAVGAPGMETPRGNFYVTARFTPYKDPFLGVFGLETSAYSKLSEWPGGGIVGIHGTNMPWLIGKAVSHGCVRVTNATAAALRKYVPVGTPILIRA